MPTLPLRLLSGDHRRRRPRHGPLLRPRYERRPRRRLRLILHPRLPLHPILILVVFYYIHHILSRSTIPHTRSPSQSPSGLLGLPRTRRARHQRPRPLKLHRDARVRHLATLQSAEISRGTPFYLVAWAGMEDEVFEG